MVSFTCKENIHLFTLTHKPFYQLNVDALTNNLSNYAWCTGETIHNTHTISTLTIDINVGTL